MNDKRIVRGNTYAAQIPTMEQARREQMEQDSRRIKRIARNTRVQVFQEEQQHEVRVCVCVCVCVCVSMLVVAPLFVVALSCYLCHSRTHTHTHSLSQVVVEGRESVPVQTDDYLEELVDKVFEKHIDTQVCSVVV
jgi:hypothetical protein